MKLSKEKNIEQTIEEKMPPDGIETVSIDNNSVDRKGFMPFFLKVGRAKKRKKMNADDSAPFNSAPSNPAVSDKTSSCDLSGTEGVFQITFDELSHTSPAEVKQKLPPKKSLSLYGDKHKTAGRMKRKLPSVTVTRKRKKTGGRHKYTDELLKDMSLDERRQLFRDVDKICSEFDKDDCYNRDDSVKDVYSIFRDEAVKYKLLTGEEEKKLAKRIEQGDENAFNTMVNSNLRLVIACAKQVYGHNKNTTILDFMDLIQEGILGLIVAVKKFDWRRNTRFSTCAVPWIYQNIVRAADSQREGFSVPGYAGFSIRNMNNDIRKYVEGTLDTSRETPARLKRIKELAAVMAPIIAIDNKEDPEETSGILTPDALTADSQEASEIVDGLQVQDYKEMLHEMLQNMLTPEEYEVLCRRYGMGQYEEYGSTPLRLISLDLGKSIEYTRIYISQIEDKIRNSKNMGHMAKLWLLPDEEKNEASDE